MGLKAGEAALVVTDQPTWEQWRALDSDRLAQMIRRNVLAKMMAEIGRQELGGSRVDFSVFPATGRSGTEPPPETAREMLAYDVVVAVTNFSITHTDARTAVCHLGGRVASMPGFLAEMFYPGGPMAVDYLQVAEDTQRLAAMLTAAELARITSAAGTDLTIPLAGRQGMSDDGAYEAPGKWGNLPAGEAYIAPPEGLAHGWLVMEPGWHPRLESTVRLRFDAGGVSAIEGEGGVADHLRSLFDLGFDDPTVASRRNAGELGIGTNPNATSVVSTLECEKIRGTVHIGIGDNAHMGGAVSSDSHMDVVINKPDLWLDDKLVIQAGAWLF
jgi:leucyl aminopeptidase (aminopeptidase T)